VSFLSLLCNNDLANNKYLHPKHIISSKNIREYHVITRYRNFRFLEKVLDTKVSDILSISISIFLLILPSTKIYICSHYNRTHPNTTRYSSYSCLVQSHFSVPHSDHPTVASVAYWCLTCLGICLICGILHWCHRSLHPSVLQSNIQHSCIKKTTLTIHNKKKKAVPKQNNKPHKADLWSDRPSIF